MQHKVIDEINIALDMTTNTHVQNGVPTYDDTIQWERLETALFQRRVYSVEVMEPMDIHAFKTNVKEAFASLKERERTVLILRFGLTHRMPLTLRDIGAELGISGERVRQIEKKALNKIKH